MRQKITYINPKIEAHSSFLERELLLEAKEMKLKLTLLLLSTLKGIFFDEINQDFNAKRQKVYKKTLTDTGLNTQGINI